MIRVSVLFLAALTFLSACAPNVSEVVSQPTNPPSAAVEATTVPTLEQPTLVEPTAIPPTATPTQNPPTQAPPPAAATTWRDLPLVNARTGESFTFADFSGRTVLVRAMAQWCSNCRQGQTNWRDNVLPQVDANNVVIVSLDIETNSTAASLAQYADGNQFPWLFAVASPDLVRELVGALGSTVQVPPSEPQWIIRPDGTLTALLTDRSASGLVSAINSAS